MFLSVLGKPNFPSVAASVVNLFAGEEVMMRGTKRELLCMTRGKTPVTSVTWYKDNKFLASVSFQAYDENVSSRPAANQSAVLSFEFVTSSDAGVYWCVAWSPWGPGEASATTVVSVIGQYLKLCSFCVCICVNLYTK